VDEVDLWPLGNPNSMPEEDTGFGGDACSSSDSTTSLSHFLQLPEVRVHTARRSSTEPLVDYSKSIILTGDEYIKAMEEKAARKELHEKEKELKKREAELTKGKRVEDKIQKEAAKRQRLVDAMA
jgi:hypothetical protein